MLTFEAIRNVVTKEKSTTKLTELPTDFFPQARIYLDKKTKMKRNDDDWELNSANTLLKDLAEIRERKIIEAAQNFVHSGANPDTMTQEESWLFETLSGTIKDWQEKKKEMLKAERDPVLVLAVLENIPRFVGLNMREYGPFAQGDITTLPKDCGKLLMDKGFAREMRIKQ